MLVCGFKMESLHIPAMAIGSLHIPAFQLGYLELMMTALLLLGTIYTVLGGMLSVLITDFLQFMVMSAGLIAVHDPHFDASRLGKTGRNHRRASRRRRLQPGAQP